MVYPDVIHFAYTSHEWIKERRFNDNGSCTVVI